ncbi:hypothetical protein R1sor_012405 [Riccia sorocarpa]|uniref:Reverse transcriptase zinc-binding domain-containing protein n=1 Tax=Riccia sorocarpa TaxID=122646 RepID=A0ABD3I9W4_9MARC
MWAEVMVNNLSVPVVNVYAPVENDVRKDFWRDLMGAIPPRKFIFMGDWNVVESPRDSSSKSNLLSRQESVNFLTFKSRFNLHDVRECGAEQRGPRYTRMQNRQGKFIWSVLDRFYAPVSFLGTFHARMIHHAEFPMSDHLPVTLLLSGSKSSTPPLPKSVFFKADPRVLQTPKVMTKIEEAWNKRRAHGPLSSPHAFFSAWREIRTLVKKAQYSEAQQLSSLEQKRKQLHMLAANHSDPDNAQPELAKLTEEVRRLQAIQDHKLRLWSREKFLAWGDTDSAYFLRRFKVRQLQGRIKTLKRDDGSVASTHNELTSEVFSFFSKVYSRPEEDAVASRDRAKLLKNVSPVISQGERAFLLDQPSYREFSDTLYSSPKGKAPGIDGFGYDAMKALWPLLGEDYVLMMQTCWSTGEFPASMLEGIIKLIPKDIRPDSLHLWRPITLLNTHYKLLAKVIANRIAILLPRVVPKQQQGFIRGRGVHGCAFARVQVNESLTPEFPLQRGVRQGCPLAPLLFALASIPFILAIQSAAADGKLKTLKLPMSSALADDTTIYLALHEPTFRLIFDILNVFQFAAGAKINFRKSKILILGRYAQIPDWLCSLPIPLLGRSEVAKYLGFSVASVLRPRDAWGQVIGSLAGRVRTLQDKHMSFEGRYITLKCLVQSKLSFVLSAAMLNKAQLKTIKQLFRILLWGVSKGGKPKIPLVAWDLITAPLSLGGLGLWDLQKFNWAFFAKFVGSLISAPPDAAWPTQFGMVSSEDAGTLCLGGWAALPWGQMLRLDLLPGSDIASLKEKFSNVPTTFDHFSFTPTDWKLNVDGFNALNAFPVTVSSAYLALSLGAASNSVKALNHRWNLSWGLDRWTHLFRLIWSKGIPRREGVFLWRVLFKGFFFGAEAARCGHSNVGCRDCGALSEDQTHVFVNCPGRTGFWRALGNNCQVFSTIAQEFTDTGSVPMALEKFSPFRCRYDLRCSLSCLRHLDPCGKGDVGFCSMALRGG